MPKYQVFISSTYEDLKGARAIVRDVVLGMHQFPVGMEYFGATSEDQWTNIKAEIDQSDYYVLIIGHRYGSIISDGPDKGISYTEKEFRYALETGVPILAFIISDKATVRPDQIDMDPERVSALKAFKERVKQGRTVDFWDTELDLARQVSNSLHNEIAKNKRPGWVRADQIQNEEKRAYDTEKLTQELLFSLKYMRDGMTLEELAKDCDASVDTISPLIDSLAESDMILSYMDNDVERYIFNDPKHPRSGEHIVYDGDENILSRGIWENYELVVGTEYDWIICDEDNVLVYNPETNDYDGEPDSDISKYMQFYDSEYRLSWLYPYLHAKDMLERFYICDIRVDHNTEEYFNIRKLTDWMKSAEPQAYAKIMAFAGE